MKQTIETQRLRLLRLVAGLLAAIGFLSVGPVSRSFADWVCGYVVPILSRAETAAQYLVIAQARLMAARSGLNWDQSRFSDSIARAFKTDETDSSLSDCNARLRALRAVLMDLPRHAQRLIRRIEKQMRGTLTAERPSPRREESLSGLLGNWRLATLRIERPPD